MLTDFYPPKDDFGKVINQTGAPGGFVRGAFDTKEPVGKVENGISGDKFSTFTFKMSYTSTNIPFLKIVMRLGAQAVSRKLILTL